MVRIVIEIEEKNKEGATLSVQPFPGGVVTATEDYAARAMLTFCAMFAARMGHLTTGKPLETLIPKAMWKQFPNLGKGGKDLPPGLFRK